MKNTMISKWNVMLLLVVSLLSVSCSDNVLPTDDFKSFSDGNFPLSFNAKRESHESRVLGKTSWVEDTDIIGVRFGDEGPVGKYKIVDAQTGSTSAETEISWPSVTSTINA